MSHFFAKNKHHGYTLDETIPTNLLYPETANTMFRKILGISIVLCALGGMFLLFRRIWLQGGVLGSAISSDDVVVEQLNNSPLSGDLSTTPSLQLDTSVQTGAASHGAAPQLVVAMPGRLYADARQYFFDRMQEQLSVEIEFVHAASMRDYKAKLQERATSIDIALIPTDWRSDFPFSPATIQLPTSYYGTIDARRQDELLHQSGTMIPYLTDPIVAIHEAPQTSRSDMATSVVVADDDMLLPLSRGWDSISQQLWQRDGEIVPHHRLTRQMIVSHLLHYQQPEIWEDIVTLVQQNTDRQTLQIRSWTANQSDTYCVDHVVGCLLRAKQTRGGVVLLSDIMAWMRYYPDHDWSQYHLTALELGRGDYPARGRGWMINQDRPQHHSLLLTIIREYLDSAIGLREEFRGSYAIAPFLSWQDIVRHRPEMQGILSIAQKRHLTTPSTNLLDNIFPLVMQGEYDPRLYLSQPPKNL